MWISCLFDSNRSRTNYKSVFDLEGLIASNGDEQIKLIWDKSFTSLKAAAYAIKNNELSNAVDYTYKKGIEIGIDPNFQLIVRDFIYNGGLLKAALWIKFFNGKMHSSLKLEKSGSVLLELPIDEAKNGIEFFLDMYKEIEIKDDIIIIKGLKDASYLPLKIPIPQMY